MVRPSTVIWHENFTSWDALKDARDERFHRMWTLLVALVCPWFPGETEPAVEDRVLEERIAGGYTVDWSSVSDPACPTNALSGLMNSMISIGKKNFVDGPAPIVFSASRY